MAYEQRKIQQVLKKLMKQKGLTYADVADKLEISEATVKRRLNGSDLSVQQLTEFSQVFSISFYELIELSKLEQRDVHEFTVKQEAVLASAPVVMKIFRSVLAGRSFAEVRQHLNLSEKDMRRFCRQLEEAGLVELSQGDRIIPLVRFPFRWRPNGVLDSTYHDFILENIFRQINKRRKSAGLYAPFEFALTPESYKGFCQEISEVRKKYQTYSQVQLDQRVDWSHLVSGVFFVDQFSVWD